MKVITKKEWLWVLIFACLVMLVTVVPYIYGMLIKPDNLYFSGVHRLNSGDTYSYLAWMQQAREGNWLFKILYTTEAQPRVIFLPFFLVMGWLARLTNLSNIAFFHLSRFILGIIFLLVAYKFLALFFNEVRKRKIALAVLALSSGLGWLFGNYSLSTDKFMTESITFLNLYESPLNLISLILILTTFYFLLRSFKENQKRFIGFSGLSLLFLHLIHPFDSITVMITVVFLMTFLFLYSRDFWPKLKTAIFVILISLPGLFITIFAFIKNPALHSWHEANVRLSPSFWAYLSGYGLLIVLALFSIKKFSVKEDKFSLVMAWLITTLILIWQPFLHFQRKFALGLHIPIVILAVIGLFGLAKKFKLSRKFVIGLIIVLSFTNIKIMLNDTYSFDSLTAPYYWNQDYITAIEWLADQEKGVVLTNPSISNIVPGLSGQTVYSGHTDQTKDREHKIEEFKWFISSQGTITAKRQFLSDKGINYILYLTDLVDEDYVLVHQDDLGLEQIYFNDSCAIFGYN